MGTTSQAIRLQDAGLSGFGKTLLEPSNWELKKGRVMVLIGPAGTGKSALMRALAGRNGAELERSGNWSLDGRPLDVAASERICHVPQAVQGARRKVAEVRAAVDVSNSEVILLDEPDHGLSNDELSELESVIRDWKVDRAVVVITHNLQFARQVGDDAALLCAGRFWAQGDAESIFDNPPNDMTRRFLEQGNCWPGPTPVELPKHFYWIVDEQLAGMGKPGLMRPAAQDLEAIALAGITQLVSLTKQPVATSVLSGFGIEGRHFPIEDMGIPGEGNTVRLCRSIERTLENGGRVAVHCHAGLGRTGTVLAAYLIYRGDEPEHAIAHVRSINPKFIQSDAQIEFLRRFTG